MTLRSVEDGVRACPGFIQVFLQRAELGAGGVESLLKTRPFHLNCRWI